MINRTAFYQVLFLFSMTVLLGVVQACVIKVPRERKQYWDWHRHPDKRKVQSCECGKDAPDAGFKANETWEHRKTEFPWTVFIHVNDTNSKTHKTCVGTIIASDLVVTSHSCFLLKQKPKLRLHNILGYRFVNPETSRTAASIDHVKVTRTKIVTNITTIYNVTRIYFNPRYLESSEAGLYPENDLAVLKVDVNFLNKKNDNNTVPICVPTFGERFRLKHTRGTFYGYFYENNANNHKKSEKPDTKKGTIFRKEYCYSIHSIQPSAGEKDQASWKKTLCLPYGSPWWYMEGSPLTTNLGSQAFLMGVANNFTKDTNITGPQFATKYKPLNPNQSIELYYTTNVDAVYASSIFPLVHFLEHIGMDSIWCKTPRLEMQLGNTSLEGQFGSPWPWKKVPGPIQRDEELDCACGINNNQPTARITGGVEATPFEFGWLVYLVIWHHGRGNGTGPEVCGGAIINDRMILTAAHCLVTREKYINVTFLRTGEYAVPVENIDAYINNHESLKVVGTDPANLKFEVDKPAIKVELASLQFHIQYVMNGTYLSGEFDVAVLILKEPLEFVKGREPGIRPICLHKMGKYINYVGRNATVAGWGLIVPEGYSPPKFPAALQKRVVPIQLNKECRRAHKAFAANKGTVLLCAGTLDKWQDSAPGDSGGPLIVQNTTQDPWFEVGIVAFGKENKKKNITAAYYTNVQKVTDYVDYHAKREGAKWCAN